MTVLSKAYRKQLERVTGLARELAEGACRAALENLAVHEREYRAHMDVAQRQLRNRLRARGRALGDGRDPRSGVQAIKRLSEHAAYEHWHRLLFTRFLTENGLLITDEANGSVPITLAECEELASELGARRALARLGLADEAARDDVSDLRQLLGAWRDAKKGVWAAVIDWAVRGMLALLVVGLAMKLGLPGLLK